MGTREKQVEADALLEDCAELLHKYGVLPSVGKLTPTWLKGQIAKYEGDWWDFGSEIRVYVRKNYKQFKEQLPRDVCSFLYELMHTWCIGTWEEDPRPPTRSETSVYLYLANHFWFESGRFSHVGVVEMLEEVYKFMVDRGGENIPGLSPLMSGKERRRLKDKYYRKWMRDNPDVVQRLREENINEIEGY